MTDLPHPVVAVDGTAASGKSTFSRQLAQRLGFVYVNTGAMYRGVTWYLQQKGVPLHDAESAELFGCKVGDPVSPEERAEAESRAKAIVLAATHFNDPKIVAEASEDCLGAMKGLAVGTIEEEDMMQNRGW